MAREPTSLISDAMPSAGMPLVQGEDVEIEEDDQLDLGVVGDLVEEEDGSVLIGEIENLVNEEMQSDPDANLAEVIDERVLMDISSELLGYYEDDKSSRQDWEDAYTDGLSLLGIKYEEREEPFRGSSGVTHPVIAEAVTQFQAQAYKELLPSSGPVRTQVVGAATPDVQAQAQRVQEFMNYQIIHRMEEYDPEMDRLLFYLPLAGSAFKKVYFDDMLDRAVSRFVPADDLLVPYNATDIQTASRITHVIRMNSNDVRKYQAGGFYRDVDLLPYEQEDEVREKERRLMGVERSGSDEQDCTILEVHTDLDLQGFEHVNPIDGEPTGIKLPYIITIDEGSSKVLSVRRNWTEGDELYRRIEYFTHFKFLPGLGFYGFGLLHMIGGLGRSATSILRQLIDAGTLSNLPAGFKARGIRIRDSDEPLSPGEFRDIDVPGGALRESIMPLPYKEPSQTLMSLLGFVVDAGRRFAAIADMQVGDGNQQAAVGTTVALLERGSKVMSAIHKRLHYAQKQEFRMLARVFAESLPPMYPYNVYGAEAAVKQMDFDERVDVIPVSDPNIFSMSQRLALAQTQLQLAQSNPQMHNLYEAFRRIYEAIGVHNIEALLPAPQPPQPVDPATENAASVNMQPLKAFPGQDHDAHMTAHIIFMKTPIPGSTPPIFAALQGHLCEHIALKAREEVEKEMMAVQQQVMEVQNAVQMGQIAPQEVPPMPEMPDPESMVAEKIAQYTEEVMAALMPPPEGEQDPLVELRSKELDIKAADLQRKSQEFSERLVFDMAKEESKEEMAAEKIDSQEDIALLRAEVNRERIQQGTAGRGE
tara:strand:- start:1376 stop:3826 length:2451 start_codon:yes stop_codon:yes gene_type:complete